jgi:hypothetical protein
MSRRNKIRAIAARVAVDLRPGNRGAEYEALLRQAESAGYAITGIEDLQSRLAAGKPTDRVLAIRHDVDIPNVAGNEMFFEVEKRLGARATYYFRLSTAGSHARFIPRLLDSGFDVGYHFEEAATVAKQHRLQTREEVLSRRAEISAAFRSNCASIRASWGPNLRSAAAHGDWINRRLRFVNQELIDATDIAAAGLAFEAYDPAFLDAVGVYVSDVASPPARWARDYGLSDAIADGRNPIYLLAHERQWHSAPLVNSAANLDRLFDGIRYRTGLGPATTANP